MSLEDALDLIAEKDEALQTVRVLRNEDLRRIQELEDELERRDRGVMAA